MSPWTALLRTFASGRGNRAVIWLRRADSAITHTDTHSGTVQYRTVSFMVEARSVYTVSLGANAGDKMEFSFDADLDINVRLVSPMGAELVRWDRVEHLNNRGFTATVTGVHSLRFDNSFSILTAKNVNLRYRVTPAD